MLALCFCSALEMSWRDMRIQKVVKVYTESDIILSWKKQKRLNASQLLDHLLLFDSLINQLNLIFLISNNNGSAHLKQNGGCIVARCCSSNQSRRNLAFSKFALQARLRVNVCSKYLQD